jgi:hypothetical protein
MIGTVLKPLFFESLVKTPEFCSAEAHPGEITGFIGRYPQIIRVKITTVK